MEDQDQWDLLDIVSSARLSGCKRTLEDRRKDKQITDQMDILPALNVSLYRKVDSYKGLFIRD